MGEVENAHHAGDDAKTQHHEDDDCPEAQDFKDGTEHGLHAASPVTDTGGPRAPKHPSLQQDRIGALTSSSFAIPAHKRRSKSSAHPRASRSDISWGSPSARRSGRASPDSRESSS